MSVQYYDSHVEWMGALKIGKKSQGRMEKNVDSYSGLANTVNTTNPR